MRLAAFLAALVLLAAPVHAARTALVAQLAAPPGDAARSRERAGILAIERAAPRLAALGLAVARGLLDGLPARGVTAARAGGDALALRTFAPERVVLLEAHDPAAADSALAALAASGLVDWVEPLVPRTLQLASLAAAPVAPPVPWAAQAALLDSLPDDPYFRDTKQWGLWNAGPAGAYGGVARADVHAREAWALSVGDDALKLAVADTGIDPDQPELGGLLANGQPRIVDALNVTAEPVPVVTDSFGHGTPVAGVMAARTNDGPHVLGGGVAGLCGGDGATTAGCRIVPIKISPGHEGEATSFDIARAILHATHVGARAMNLSFAGPASARIERLALTYAITHGCVVVGAAGNSGTTAPTKPQYPSAYAAEGLCIQVGASSSFDQRVNFSSYGPGLDLLAPGVNVYTTFMTYPSWAGGSYADACVAASGTSFAAPFVAGAVGLLASARPELADTDFQQVLRGTADDVGAPGVDAQTGWGRLNVGRALHAVRPEIGIWHDEVAADSLVPDGSGALAVGESGPGTLDRWRGTIAATRWAAYATVTVPDSLVDSLQVWPRVGGTLAVRGDWRLPYFAATAEVVARTARTFTLRGWLYRTDEDGSPEGWIPLPPEYVRFGFTVLGRAARALPAPVAGAGGNITAAPLAAGPNPFRGALEVRAAAPGRVAVYDALGRRVRTLEAVNGRATWDGRDTSGRSAAPGLYFVRWSADRRAHTLRVVRLAE